MAAEGRMGRALAREYGVDRTPVQGIVANKLWRKK
jgi:hypothetical protein